MKKLIAIALLFLAGCGGEGEMDLFRYAPGGAGDMSRPLVPAPAPPAPAPAQVPATGAAKMLQDPEAMESNGSDYVWADNRDAAWNMCQRIAERNGWRLDDVDNGEGIALQTGRKRFTCYFTMFGAPRP